MDHCCLPRTTSHATSHVTFPAFDFSSVSYIRLLYFSLFFYPLFFASGSLFSDQNPSEMDALCPSPPGPSRPQRNYERIGEQTGTS